MIIWVLDYASGEVLKINPLPETRDEIGNKYDDCVGDWLEDHEEELGIRMKDCYYMVTTNDDDWVVRYINI